MYVQRIFLSLGADAVQTQRLVTFCLQKDASKWWDIRRTLTQKLTGTRDPFIKVFEKQLILETSRI